MVCISVSSKVSREEMGMNMGEVHNPRNQARKEKELPKTLVLNKEQMETA